MEFEFDPEKSAANLTKHGIDFVTAQRLWQDDRRITGVPSFAKGEERFYAIGMIDDKLWSAFYTPRGERIRIISVRRAREQEKERYDENNYN